LFYKINNKYLEAVSCKPILLERHKHLILKASHVLAEYQEVTRIETDVAILSQELNTLGHCISELVGIISPDQILNSIFSNFCIGK
jgi:tRNA modification GTPase